MGKENNSQVFNEEARCLHTFSHLISKGAEAAPPEAVFFAGLVWSETEKYDESSTTLKTPSLVNDIYGHFCGVL